MQRAIEIARRATGLTSPNPLVGCVIVKDGSIVGEGWHKAAGLAHAEAVAIAAAGKQCHGATLYVTLEPCAHHGRTPPCTDAIVAAGIREVVYAVDDPNLEAHGGAQYLKQHGIAVTAGVEAEAGRQLTQYFFHHTLTGKPFVIAKFASSLDGRIATHTGHSQWITGASARQRGHHLRQAVDAILVGAQTVIDDDPQLTVRVDTNELGVDTVSHPLRIVLDSLGRIPLERQVLAGTLPGHTCVVTSHKMPIERERILNDRGIDCLRLPIIAATNHINLDDLLRVLGQRSVQSLLVEGGHTVLGSFVDAGLVDEVWAFVAPMLIGGKSAPAAIGGVGIDRLDDALRLHHLATEVLGEDLLIRGQVINAQEHL